DPRLLEALRVARRGRPLGEPHSAGDGRRPASLGADRGAQGLGRRSGAVAASRGSQRGAEVTSLLVFAAIAALSVLASSQKLLEAGRFFALAQLSASGLLFLALGALLSPHALALLKPADVD